MRLRFLLRPLSLGNRQGLKNTSKRCFPFLFHRFYLLLEIHVGGCSLVVSFDTAALGRCKYLSS